MLIDVADFFSSREVNIAKALLDGLLTKVVKLCGTQ